MHMIRFLAALCVLAVVGVDLSAQAQPTPNPQVVGCYHRGVRVADCECTGGCGGGGGSTTRSCPAGQVYNSVGRCIPAGAVDCGDDQWCPAGNRCSPHGCLSADQIDCGTHICDAGKRCGSGTQCLSATDDDCGDGKHCSSGGTCSAFGNYCIRSGRHDCRGFTCGAGQRCGSGQQCISLGEEDCGNGSRCTGGKRCSANRNFCVRAGQTDCGTYVCGPGLKCAPGDRCTADVARIEDALSRLKSAVGRGPLPLGLAQQVIDELDSHVRLRGGVSAVGAAYVQYIIRQVLEHLVDHVQRTGDGSAYALISQAYAGWASNFGVDPQLASKTIRERTRGQYTGMEGGQPPGLTPHPDLVAATPQIRVAIELARGVTAIDTSEKSEADPKVCWGDTRKCSEGFPFKFRKSSGEFFLPASEESPTMKVLHAEILKGEEELKEIRTGAKPFADPYVRMAEEAKVLATLKAKSEAYETEVRNSRKVPERN